MKMPVLFLAHGSPMTLQQPHRMGQFQALGASLPKPKAILVLSAHWETQPVMLGTTSTLPLIYDFYGFPEALYRLQYAAPGAPELAQRVKALLTHADQPYAERQDRGWDHGVWVPLLGLFPHADIPLLQMSLPSGDAGELMALGRLLAPLRDEGVLIIGSGLITHNLREWTPEGVVAPWARDFDAWVAERLEAREWQALCAFAQAPGARQSHPSVEHLLPLFVTVGASEASDHLTFPSSGFEFGSFSHRSVQFSAGE